MKVKIYLKVVITKDFLLIKSEKDFSKSHQIEW